jgi:hypothetical protein
MPSSEGRQSGWAGRWVLRRLLVNVAMAAMSLCLFGLLFVALAQP